MRRLLQIGTLLFLAVTFVTPVLEWFDRWDASGLGNDTEFAVFVFCLGLCLVLVLMKLLSGLALQVGSSCRQIAALPARPCWPESIRSHLLRPPLLATPLRI